MKRARTAILAIGMVALALSSSSRSLLAFEPQTKAASKPPERAVTQVPDKSSRVLRQRQEQQVVRCTVPNLIGLNVNAATGTLEKARLSLGGIGRRADSRPTGTVIDQSAKPDSQVPCGSRIDVVSAFFDDGPRLDCTVPKLTGNDEGSAKKDVTGAKLVVGRVDRRPDSRQPVGTVTDQSPQPGKPVRCGSHVDFRVAVGDVGPPLCRVPSLLSDDVSSARKALESEKLTLGNVDTRRDSRPKGSIIDQSPERGALVPCGSPVGIAVAVPPEVQTPSCTVPSLLDADAQSAEKELGGKKLSLGRVVSRTDSRPQGTVIDQAPQRGARVLCGSPVDIVVAVRPEVQTPYCAVPGLFGADASLVKNVLGKARLTRGKTGTRQDTRPAGTVIQQWPEVGARVPCGSPVDVIVADAPECQPIPAPSLIGRDEKLAIELIAGSGLRVGNVTRRESDQPTGTIVGQSYPPQTFVKCDAVIDLVVAERVSRVPLLSGNDAIGTRRKLADAGLRLGKTYERESTLPKGTVVDQTPAVGTVVKPDSAVDVWLAVQPPIAVPDLRGRDRASASGALTRLGLRLADVGERESHEKAGNVVDQTPSPGTPVKPDTTVRVWVAVPMPVEVPDLVGRGTQEADSILMGSHLRTGVVRTRESTEARGSVIQQSPTAGTRVSPGTPVDLWAASPPLPSLVPPLTGHLRADALALIRSAGLSPGRMSERESNQAPGTVVGQRPLAGTEAQRGSAVDISLAIPVRVTTTAVPNLIGQRRDNADFLLGRQTLRIGAVMSREYSASAGVIIDQRPAAGQQVSPGSTVDIWIATPLPTVQVTVPDLRGRTQNDATTAIEELKLLVGPVSERESAEPRGTVIAQDPPAGSVVDAGAPVSVWLAVPIVPIQAQPTLITVPRLLNYSLEQAFVVLRAAGLQPGTVAQTPSAATTGTVTYQSLAAGVQVAPGTAIDLIVALPITPASSFLPLRWLGAGALLGLGVAAAASVARARQHRLANTPELTPYTDAGFQTSVPDNENLVDFEVTLEACPDDGAQTLDDANGFVAGQWPGNQVMSW